MAVRDEAEFIGAQLQALAGQSTRDWELVVVDDASTDGTAALVRTFAEHLPAVKVLTNAQRVGNRQSLLRGCAAARSPKVLLLDGDDVVAPDYVEAMCAALDRADVVAARMEHDTLNGPLAGHRLRMQEHGLAPWNGFLPWGHGCSLGFNRQRADLDAFLQVPSGDSCDVAICWAAQLAGHSIAFVPEAVLHYRYRTGLRRIWRQGLSYGANQVVLYRTFRAHGMPRVPMRVALRRAARTFASIVKARRRTHVARWLHFNAMQVGRIVGSIRHREVYL